MEQNEGRRGEGWLLVRVLRDLRLRRFGRRNRRQQHAVCSARRVQSEVLHRKTLTITHTGSAEEALPSVSEQEQQQVMSQPLRPHHSLSTSFLLLRPPDADTLLPSPTAPLPRRSQHKQHCPVVWLSDSDSLCIHDSWQLRVANRAARPVGLSIFMRMVVTSNQWSQMFNVDGRMSVSEMENVKEVQGQRIEMFLSNLVTALGCAPESVVRSLCSRIGAVHYEQSVNFDEAAWHAFRAVAIDEIVGTVVLDQEYVTIDDVNEFTGAWNKLISVIQEEMCQGFLAAAEKSASQDNGSRSPSTFRAANFGMRMNASARSLRPHRNLSTSSDSVIGDALPKNSRSWSDGGADDAVYQSASIIRDFWNKVDGFEICRELFLRLVSQNTQFGRRFNVAEADCSLEQLQRHTTPELDKQIVRVHNFFTTIFELVGFMSMNQISGLCRRVGEIHFHHGVNFTADNWLLFKRAIVEAFGHAAQALRGKSRMERLELERAIGRFAQFLLHEMKSGFIERVLVTFTRGPEPPSRLAIQTESLEEDTGIMLSRTAPI